MKISLIADQAIGEDSTRDVDGLGFEIYARTLAAAASDTRGPFTIGWLISWCRCYSIIYGLLLHLNRRAIAVAIGRDPSGATFHGLRASRLYLTICGSNSDVAA